MKIKYLLFAFLLAGCSAATPPDSTPEECASAADAGRKAAVEALKNPKGSMALESALFEIRSRESELRSAGFTLAADSFTLAAEAVLLPVLGE